MFVEVFPVFERDMILKADMLNLLKEYPRNMFSLQYYDYSDGILSGTTVKVREDSLVVLPGILKHKGKIYHMEKEVEVPFYATGGEQILKLRFLEEETGSDCTICRSEIVLDGNLEIIVDEIEVDEIELCRFTLKTGAVLRQDYQDFSDFATLHNTVNILHVQYAGYNQPTISLEITKFFGKELLKYMPKDPYDVSFAMLCLQENVMDLEVIKSYLTTRLLIRGDTMLTNEQIYRYLQKAMEQVKSGSRGGAFGDNRGRRLIVE